MSVTDSTEALGQMIDAGLTASEAGRRLHITRNAAIGRASRRGWRFGTPRAATPPRQPKPEPKAPMTALATILEDDAEPLDALAAELLTIHRLTPKALPHMLERVMADDDLRNACLVRLVEGECRRILDARLSYRHQQFKRQTGGGPLGPKRSNDMSGWAGAVADSLMNDFRLPGGCKLGDATRADLSTALSNYQIHADDAMVKHRWLTLVLQSTPPGKTVRQALTDERLAELRTEARKVEQ